MLRIGKVAGLWLLLAATLSVCLAQSIPSLPLPTDGAAKVMALTGRVSVWKDTGLWALNTGDLVQVKQLIVTGPDGYAQFQVADGSTFEVYPDSQVTFRNNSGTWQDLVDVWIGRIKTHIQKLGGQPNYNRVHTPTAVISVRGTTFDVEVKDDGETLVVVEEGEVEVQHAQVPGKPKMLGPGQWLRVFPNVPLAKGAMDKGSIHAAVFRALSDALFTILTQNHTGGLGGSSSPGVGDRKAPPPPPTAPPPPVMAPPAPHSR
jgi:ferric-dicitrate binding protein FerR (iron transport regulator)